MGTPDEPTDTGGGSTPTERRSRGRRTYNRRQEDSEIVPPYFETFERIATALEHIAALLQRRQVTLPDVKVGTTQSGR